MLFQMKREGMTVITSTVYLDEGELCDKLAIMHSLTCWPLMPLIKSSQDFLT